jgi:hypothetical protein
MGSLSADLTRALDPTALATAVGTDPDPWQAEVLRSDAPETRADEDRDPDGPRLHLRSPFEMSMASEPWVEGASAPPGRSV